LIVDDHRLFADVIASVLQQNGMEVVGIAPSGRDAIEMTTRLAPDVILLDIGLPDDDGMTLGRKLLQLRPSVKVVAVTSLVDARAVGEALRGGFSGYITKETPLVQFVGLVRSALDGQVVIPQKLAAAAAGVRTQDERHALLMAEQLSPREREVLTLLVEGCSSGEMARRLRVSPNTVRTHVQSILTKLQVHSRLQAATFAVRFGLVKVPASGDRRPVPLRNGPTNGSAGTSNGAESGVSRDWSATR
jgi:two-component system nitrate/nitrite response regulator NarL